MRKRKKNADDGVEFTLEIWHGGECQEIWGRREDGKNALVLFEALAGMVGSELRTLSLQELIEGEAEIRLRLRDYRPAGWLQ